MTPKFPNGMSQANEIIQKETGIYIYIYRQQVVNCFLRSVKVIQHVYLVIILFQMQEPSKSLKTEFWWL